MLKPSKKIALALEAVTDIAYHGGAEPVQSQDIARRLGLPRRYLEQVMQQLVRATILRGVRGPRGGYRLARERRRIRVVDIVKVVNDMEWPEAAEQRSEALAEQGGLTLAAAVLDDYWREVEQAMLRLLGEATIEDLCRRAEAAGVERAGRPGGDFVI